MKKNCIKSDFKEISLKLATNNRNDKMFLLTSKFYPQGDFSPCLGAIFIYKIRKKLYKIRLQRFFFKLVANDRSDKSFLLTSKFCPLGLSAPDLRLYTSDSHYVDFAYLDTITCRSDFSLPAFFLYIYLSLHFNSVYVENG